MKVFDNEPIDLVDLNFEWIVSTADIKHALEKAIDKINELVERVNKLPVECSCKEKPSTGQEEHTLGLRCEILSTTPSQPERKNATVRMMILWVFTPRTVTFIRKDGMNQLISTGPD